MADAITNAFEIERRAIMWTPLTTLNDGVTSLGYDADPNSANPSGTDGEQWLYGLPIGQFYKQSDSTLWWKSETPNTWIQLDTGGSGSGDKVELELTCTTNEDVGDFVYINNSGVCITADHSDIDTAKVIGVITEKPTTTTCKVVCSGLANVFSSLTPGNIYFLGTNGGVTNTPPNLSGDVITVLGKALTSTLLLIELSNTYTIRS